jgi:hypothetical protein
LKHAITTDQCFQVTWVATVLTVYGIETLQQYERYRSLVLVGIKFTIYGI